LWVYISPPANNTANPGAFQFPWGLAVSVLAAHLSGIWSRKLLKDLTSLWGGSMVYPPYLMTL
jgi:hypothetical protein